MNTKQPLHDPEKETQMGAFWIPIQVGREFRAACALYGVSQRDIFAKLMQDFVAHPKRWLDDQKGKK